MRDTVEILLFELKKRFTLASTYVYFAVFFVAAFLLMLAAGGAFSSVSVASGSEKVHANAPFMIHTLVASLSYFGVLVTAAVFGQAVHQDFESGMYPLFFTTPVEKSSYLAGRFLGALVVMLLVFSSIALGLAAAASLPFLDRAAFGTDHFSYYIWPYLTTVLPNLLFTGGIFFALATLGRRMMPVYVGGVVLLIGYLIASTISSKLENRAFAALLDPFGTGAVARVTEYWTIDEKNGRVVPLEGLFLWNRVVWSGVGAVLVALTFARFRMGEVTERRRRRAAIGPLVAVDGAGAGAAAAGALPTVATRHEATIARSAVLLAHLAWMAFKETVKNVYFLVIVLAGVLFMVVASRAAGTLFGTSTYPVTYAVLELSGGSFSLFIVILVTLFSGELVWRERDARMDQLLDACPVPTWLPFVSKLLGLFLVQVVLLAVVMVAGIAIQTSQGYHHYELGLYVKDLFGIKLIDYCLLVVLAMTVQTLVQQKYIGHFVMITFYVFTLFMDKLGLEHHLYKYGNAPGYQYSDMNGYGHFLRPVYWFDIYWACWAILLAILSHLFWARGLERRMHVRLSLARARLTPALGAAAALTFVALCAAGGYVYYNTNVLNHYRSSHANETERADYEKQYRPHAKEPQPRVIDVKLAFDIFPSEHRLRVRGVYTLQNKNTVPVTTVYVAVPEIMHVRKLGLGPLAAPTREDRRLDVYTFDLPRPMPPGAVEPLELDLELFQAGFEDSGYSTQVVDNGTFFSSGDLPHIGYQESFELSDDRDRRNHGLPPKPRMADAGDLEARRNNYITSDADWIAFDATVSTSPDQIAIAPGYLQKEWSEGGRRYFHYKMDTRILHFFSVLSARYEVKRDRWSDVALEIYYHRGHEYDLDRMMLGMKRALAYCSAAFGPYQHRQVRIIEFPRYAQFAQSFPNTIPYSEAIGFIAKVDPDNPEDVDYPFYVTAHEVAHQWWAHQVIGGNVQGATMLSETLAQYSALMVMKKELGAGHMKRFLRYELDGYLRGRAFEQKKELPLVRVENQQYIHYQKGSLVMYALQDYLGEEKLDRVLAAFVARTKQQEPPYASSLELVDAIRKATPPDLQYLIEDLFETITLYDNRALSATYHPNGKGGYDVKVKVLAKKLRADELGKESDRPVDDLIDVGVLDDKGEPLALEKRRLKGGETVVSLTVDKLPARAGIDPLNKLIDRKPDDNVVAVEKE